MITQYFDIIDDFLFGPEEVINEAGSAAFQPNHCGTQHALFSVQPAKQAEALATRIIKHLNDSPLLDGYPAVDCYQGGRYRVVTSDNPKQQQIHIDPFGFFAVLYLSAPKIASGTAFFRHPEVGAVFAPDPAADLQKLSELRQSAMAAMQSGSGWEEYDTIEMKFNRLVVGNGNYFHAGFGPYGSDQSDGRLTMNFFFYNAAHYNRCMQSVFRNDVDGTN